MRRFLPVFILILAGISQAQRGTLPSSSDPRQPRNTQHSGPAAAPATPATSGVQPKPAVEIAPDAPVITIHGLCPAESPASADPAACTTIITRDQFEDILSAVSLGGQAFAPGAIRNVADSYVQYLVLADAARKIGADKDPKVQELLKVVRMRTLADAYRNAMQEKFRTPPQDEIEKYYRENIARFESVRAERLVIPRFNPKSPKEGAGEFQKKAQAVAAEIRERAIKGENLDRLQSEAFLKLGLHAPALLPETGARRRGTFPPGIEEEVFSLKPGEVSKVESETDGLVVYRLIRKDTATLEQARGEIVRDLFKQKMDVTMNGVLGSVKADLNDQYFAPKPAGPPPPNAPPRPVTGKGAPSRTQGTHSVKLPPVSAKPAPGNQPPPPK